MAEKYNCPNCGAPIGHSDKCEYCGTLLRWIPITYMEFIPKSLHVQQAEAAAEWDREKGELDREVLDRLSNKLANFIINEDAYTLSFKYDICRKKTIVIMRTYVGK